MYSGTRANALERVQDFQPYSSGRQSAAGPTKRRSSSLTRHAGVVSGRAEGRVARASTALWMGLGEKWVNGDRM